MTRLFNFRTQDAPVWYLRVLWLRVMYWRPRKATAIVKPILGPWFSVRLRRKTNGTRLHFDIGPIEGIIAKL